MFSSGEEQQLLSFSILFFSEYHLVSLLLYYLYPKNRLNATLACFRRHPKSLTITSVHFLIPDPHHLQLLFLGTAHLNADDVRGSELMVPMNSIQEISKSLNLTVTPYNLPSWMLCRELAVSFSGHSQLHTGYKHSACLDLGISCSLHLMQHSVESHCRLKIIHGSVYTKEIGRCRASIQGFTLLPAPGSQLMSICQLTTAHKFSS